jgi:hypothetical protein
LRKLLMGAVAASATLAVAAAAIAQSSPATLRASASPADAGTPSKPKNTKVGFDVVVDLPGTTVQTIVLKLPSTLKLSGKGLGRCSYEDLNFDGPTACPAKSKAGPVGEAHAVAGPQRAPVDFTVMPFVEDSNTLLFYLNAPAIGLQQAIRGEITSKGHTLTLTIPPELRHPGNLDSSLTGLKQSFSAKVGNKYLVSSTGCKNKKWKFTGQFGFATDRIDGASAPPPMTFGDTVKCKK